MDKIGSHMKAEGKRRRLVVKTIDLCRTLSQRSPSPNTRKPAGKISPRSPPGYLTVCVGPGRERFTIKMEYANHPGFKVLLDEAAMEYGFSADGPLELPCDVGLFGQVLQEVEQEKCRYNASPLRRLVKGNEGYKILSPSRLAIKGRY